MNTIPDRFIEALPKIYRYILEAFPRVDPARKKGYGLAIQTIYAHQKEPAAFDLGQIHTACLKMTEKGVVEIRNGIFVHPTDLGEQLIAKLTGKMVLPDEEVPDFPSISS